MTVLTVLLKGASSMVKAITIFGMAILASPVAIAASAEGDIIDSAQTGLGLALSGILHMYFTV